MNRFTISPCDVVPQFNDNSKTQLNKGKVYQGIRTPKTFEFENKGSNVKKMLRSL